jgi:hypothetical protein
VQTRFAERKHPQLFRASYAGASVREAFCSVAISASALSSATHVPVGIVSEASASGVLDRTDAFVR